MGRKIQSLNMHWVDNIVHPSLLVSMRQLVFFSDICYYSKGKFGHSNQITMRINSSLYDSFASCGCFTTFKNQKTDFIKEYRYWFLTLNQKQEFLGRSLLILKEHKIDESELTEKQMLEKYHIYCAWKKAIDHAFMPDKINQALSGNEETLHHGHLHWHFIPRYRRLISFAGQHFFNDTLETQSLPIRSIKTKIVCLPHTRALIKKELLRYL